MIRSFKDKETEAVFHGIKTGHFPADILRRAYSKLQQISIAANITDLKVPPSNHLEKLLGDRQDQYSIRINDKYRICFKWAEQSAEEVEITDYHK